MYENLEYGWCTPRPGLLPTADLLKYLFIGAAESVLSYVFEIPLKYLYAYDMYKIAVVS